MTGDSSQKKSWSLTRWIGQQFGGMRLSSDHHRLASTSRHRIVENDQATVIYAIGDVHGCLDKLLQLEETVQYDARTLPGRKLIVMLGDYIDRGPSSAQVIDHLIARPPENFDRICLFGNHEDVFLDLIKRPEALNEWLSLGGEQTIFSYGIDIEYYRSQMGFDATRIVEEIFQAVPETHVDFLRSLPVSVTTSHFFFAHAGARPGTALEQQTDHDLMWIRGDFLDHVGPGFAKTVVHGHTPASVPFVSPYRVGLDTGAYAGGPLTAARFEGKKVAVLQSY